MKKFNDLKEIGEVVTHTLTSFGLKGKVNSPCLKPFFSKNIMSCLFGLLCVDVIKFPMGLQNTAFGP